MVASHDDISFSEECEYNLSELPVERWFTPTFRPFTCYAAPALLVDADDIEFRSEHSSSDLDCDECPDSICAAPGILRKRHIASKKRKHQKKVKFVDFHLGLDARGKVLGCDAHNRVLSHDTFKHSAIWAYDPVEYWCPNCDPEYAQSPDAARMRALSYMEYQSDYFEVEGAGWHGTLESFRTACDYPTTKNGRGRDRAVSRSGQTPNQILKTISESAPRDQAVAVLKALAIQRSVSDDPYMNGSISEPLLLFKDFNTGSRALSSSRDGRGRS